MTESNSSDDRSPLVRLAIIIGIVVAAGLIVYGLVNRGSSTETAAGPTAVATTPSEDATVTASPAEVQPTAVPAEAQPTEAPAEGGQPSAAELENALGNMDYASQFTQSGTAALTDGAYEEEAAPGSATKTQVKLLSEYTALGELNGRPSAAVVLVTDPGGSGSFYTLHVVQEQDGQPTDVASTPLGDRVQIETVAIEDDQIVIEMVTHGPQDPLCCPTQQVVRTYALEDGQLVMTSDEVVGTTETAGSPLGAGELALEPGQISLDTQGLAPSWQAVVVPEKPYDQSQPPGPAGLPTHIEILFGESDPAAVEPGAPHPEGTRLPIMYIIPVNPYREMWNEAGNPAVTKTIAEIDRYSYMMPQPPLTSGMPVLPYEQAAGHNDLAVQIGRIVPAGELNTTSATQDGYRFVGRWAQDANPVTNQGLRYVYQGFTNDGVYLVSFWWPVSTTALPNDAGEVPADEMEQFQADSTTVISNTAGMLNGLTVDQWQPDLTTLDALVASLQIEGLVVGGLQDTLWEWVEGPAQPGGSEIVLIEDPSQYQVTYTSDGTIQYIADCNSGSMLYELRNGGTNGGMLAEFGPMTLAECGADSLSNSFASSLQASQDYRVQAGGNQMQLVLPAGGGTLIIRAAGAPTPEGNSESETEIQASQACITGNVTYTESTTLPDDTVAQVQLQDSSLMDAPAVVIGEEIIPNPDTFPIPYEVCYNTGEIEENHTYTMQARIEDSTGNMLYINDTSVPVITRGNPTDAVEIPVIEVGA